jgi:hypothetical protein
VFDVAVALPPMVEFAGNTGTWCWIEADALVWRYGAFYCVLWVVMIYDIWAYITVRASLARTSRHHSP